MTVYHLISQHTIEEKILRLHRTKRNLSDSLLEGTDLSHAMTQEELLELLQDNRWPSAVREAAGKRSFR